MKELTLKPIGTFHCSQNYPQQAPRQGTIQKSPESGVIELLPGHNFEQALEDLAGFDRIWILYWFDRNTDWKPKIKTPRDESKRGVFATRAPHRPNPIGMTCVKLEGIRRLSITVKDYDLLDGTPILDIKPYLPYADSFPDASTGWLKTIPIEHYTLEYHSIAKEKLDWIKTQAGFDLQALLETQLSETPDQSSRKRIKCLEPESNQYEFAGRTWRANYTINRELHTIRINTIASGYTESDLTEATDRYQDKEFHREFRKVFG